jgi:hypothetical protein
MAAGALPQAREHGYALTRPAAAVALLYFNHDCAVLYRRLLPDYFVY